MPTSISQNSSLPTTPWAGRRSFPLVPPNIRLGLLRYFTFFPTTRNLTTTGLFHAIVTKLQYGLGCIPPHQPNNLERNDPSGDQGVPRLIHARTCNRRPSSLNHLQNHTRVTNIRARPAPRVAPSSHHKVQSGTICHHPRSTRTFTARAAAPATNPNWSVARCRHNHKLAGTRGNPAGRLGLGEKRTMWAHSTVGSTRQEANIRTEALVNDSKMVALVAAPQPESVASGAFYGEKMLGYGGSSIVRKCWTTPRIPHQLVPGNTRRSGLNKGVV